MEREGPPSTEPVLTGTPLAAPDAPFRSVRMRTGPRRPSQRSDPQRLSHVTGRIRGQPESGLFTGDAHLSVFLVHVTPKRYSSFLKEGSLPTHPPIYQGLGTGGGDLSTHPGGLVVPPSGATSRPVLPDLCVSDKTGDL